MDRDEQGSEGARGEGSGYEEERRRERVEGWTGTGKRSRKK
jgi:hypothetical protein